MAQINSYFIISLLLFTGIQFSEQSESIKRYCSKSEDCLSEQECRAQLCVCKPKYVPHGLHCFPEVNHGEQCWFNEQCFDPLQTCLKIRGNLKRCACDGYHDYDKSIEACVPKRNLTEMLVEEHDNAGTVERQAQSTYFVILVCGISLATIGFIFLLIALIYCYHMHQSDTKLAKRVNQLSIKVGGIKGLNLKTEETDEERKRLAQASVIPIIDDNMVIG